MIRLLENFDGNGLRASHYSDTILSHLNAYGTEFDFCRFYEIFRRKRVGIICVFNSTVAVDFCEGARITGEMKREIAEFVDFQQPNVIEIPTELVRRRGFSGYDGALRRFYELPASGSAEGLTEAEPRTVFETVGASEDSFALWLTDVVRRKNRSSLWLYSYESAVLCVRFCLNGSAYVTDLVTPECDRKKGYAGALLKKTAGHFEAMGAKAYAAAREPLFGFYEHIGGKVIGEDKFFTRKR